MFLKIKPEQFSVTLKNLVGNFTHAVDQVRTSALAHMLFKDVHTTSAIDAARLIDAIDTPAYANPFFCSGVYALSLISFMLVEPTVDDSLKTLFDNQAARITRRAATWLSCDHETFSIAAENYFVFVMPTMTPDQTNDAWNAISTRYQDLLKEQSTIQHDSRQDRYEDLAEPSERVQKRIQRFDSFVRRLSPPTP